jgi:WD40 repeat protein
LDRTVKLWSVADGKCERTFTGHSYGVRTVAWRFDGKLLASGGGGDKIILWDPKKGERLKTLEGNNELVSASEFAPHGKTIMVASRDGTLKIRDVESGT